MCGINGIIKFDPAGFAEEGRLVAMRDRLAHRGPDGSGILLRGPVGFGHRRLSIIDLAGGQQPMMNLQGGIWITYNGELYNFRELRVQLQGMGCRFLTQSDTEVVLRAYEVFGDNCVEHLRGMFAFAIWDGPRHRFFMARDRLGIKPLYYSIANNELLFASEIKAILAAGSGKPVFNRAILPEFLASRFVAGDETFFEGIWKLLPAHTLTWSLSEGTRRQRYWQPALADDDTERSYEDYVAEVRSGLEEAVKCHLVSDVPVGLFLSGGLDSSVLAVLMAPLVSGPVQTFSVGFSEGGANELNFARLMARSIGATQRDMLMTPGQFFAELPRLIWHEDEPIAFSSSIPLNSISRLAREHVKVVLTGEGADELFLGYDYRYRVTALNTRLGEWYERLLPSELRQSVASHVPALPKSLRRYAERTFLAMDATPRELFFENFAVFRQSQRQRLLLDNDLLAARDPHAQGLRYYQDGGADALERMSHADLQTYLVELLMKQDQMSMAASLETRVPFLDHKLVEQVAAIPARFRMRGWETKSLLRDALRERLPGAILRRRKMGFPVPLVRWLREEFWPLVQEFVLGERARQRGLFNPETLAVMAGEHRAGTADHSERLWLLLNLEIWQRIFIDGEDPARVYHNSLQAVPAAIKEDRLQPLVLQS